MSSVAHVIRRRRVRQARRHARQSRNRTWLAILVAAIVLLVVVPGGVVFGGAAMLYWGAVGTLPEPQDTLYLDPIIGPTELYDRTGQTLVFSVEDPLGDERAWLSLAELPPYIGQATLIVEDPDFLSATRFDAFQALSRLWRNILSGPLPPDPSLTGRLVRNALLGSQATDRTREIALVAEINRRYSPEQVLEWHLNTNYYGHEAYGIEAAAQVYLGKRAADLTLDEAALLAAIPTAPQYNPLDNETAARGRQADVLRAMQVAGYITSDQFGQAAATRTPIQSGTNLPTRIAPEFTLYARRQAEDILNNLGYEDGAQMVARSGLRITTTLDLDLYYQSECALRTHLARLNGDTGDQLTLGGGVCTSAVYLPTDTTGVPSPPNGGILVVFDVATGEIKSMVGPASATNFKPDPNTTIGYQPGPTLQPFVYFDGFLSTLFTPASMVMDIPTPFPGPAEGLIYTPSNPDGQFRGPINLRDAMSVGLLPPAVTVAHNQGIDNILIIAHRIGLNSLDENARYDLSLLERGGEASVLDMSYAYSVFASMGQMRGVYTPSVARGYRQRNPVAVLRIEDSAGNLLWAYDDTQITASAVPVFEEFLGYVINDILSDQESRWPVLGQNNVLDLPRPAAVVNGLTSDDVDAWTVGYTPFIVTGVHLGRDDGQQMTLDAYGLQGAAPVWRAVMEYVHSRDGLPAAGWERPPGIIEAPVCERSGLLSNGACPVRNEIFLDSTQPTQTDTYWQTFEINSDTRQLATANTPAGLRSREVYFIPPPEARDWWAAHNLPLPPTEIDTISRPELFRSVQILQPERYSYVGGVVDIRGSLDENMQYYTLSYGQGLNPTQWFQIGDQRTTFAPGSTLGTWDTSGLDGLYNLQLTVVLNDNSRDTDIVAVTIDNAPPVIALSAGDPGQVFRFPADDVIPLVAEVQDNLAIARVEFYHNGQLLGVDAEWPYGFDWDITRTGVEIFTAVAFDQVGNQASSEITVEITRAS
jgi:membrane carboxypeptidase/penicillin-binding protein